jgi:hypothetical protein
MVPSCTIMNDLVSAPPRTSGRAFDLIDSARVHTVQPAHDFIARPETLDIYPSGVRDYAFTCSEYTTSGPDYGFYDNFELQKNRPDTAAFLVRYCKTGPNYGYGMSENRIPGKLDNRDSLLMSPLADSAYFTAFKDIDSEYILLYQSAYRTNQGCVPYCCQVFKEGLGLLYEHYHNGVSENVYVKAAVLSKVNGSPIDVVPVISRVMGMQGKFAETIRGDSIVVRVAGSLYDSIQGKKFWQDPPLISIFSDTLFKFLPYSVYAFYLFKPDSIVTLNCGGEFDSIGIDGYSYWITARIPYEFGW